MAHFAELDENNIVLRVIVVPNDQEHRGEDYLSNELGLGGRWKQTSYNKKIRKNYAGPGFIYEPELDIFLPPKPFPSWTLDKKTGNWLPPKPRPEIPGKAVGWNEETQDWDITDDPLPNF